MEISITQGSRAQGSRRDTAPALRDYEVVRRLGRGSSATVWLVRPVGANPFAPALQYAFKRFNSAQDTDRGSEQQERESWLLGKFKHENLLRYFGEAQDSGGDRRGYLLEYAPGGSALNYVSVNGPMSVGQVVTTLVGVARALAFLHSSGVVHRDVSPTNVLFSAEGRPLLADLGFARASLEHTGAGIGTQGFSEHCPGLPGREQDFASDVFSLGALAWFLLTGTIAGEEASRTPLPLLVPDIPPNVVQLVERALHEDVSQRPSAAEFASKLVRAHEAQPLDVSTSAHAEDLPYLVTRVTRDTDSKSHSLPSWVRPWRKLVAVPRGVVPRGAVSGSVFSRRAGKVSTPLRQWSEQGKTPVLSGSSTFHETLPADSPLTGERPAQSAAPPIGENALEAELFRRRRQATRGLTGEGATPRYPRSLRLLTWLSTAIVLAVLLGALGPKVARAINQDPGFKAAQFASPTGSTPTDAHSSTSGATDATAEPSLHSSPPSVSPPARSSPATSVSRPPASSAKGVEEVKGVEEEKRVEEELKRLINARGKALESADAGALEALYTPDAAALESERQLVGTMHREGWRFSSLQYSLSHVQVLQVAERQAQIQAEVTVSSYTVLPAAKTGPEATSGATEGARSAPQEQQVTFELRRGEKDWRISDVSVQN